MSVYANAMQLLGRLSGILCKAYSPIVLHRKRLLLERTVFFGNQKVKPGVLLKQHNEDLRVKLKATQNVVLMIQDSSTFSYPTHPCTKNLGRIGSRQKPGYGVITHNSLCLNADSNVAFGLAHQTYFYHSENDKADKRPIEEKESYRWIEHLRHNHALCPTAIHICDREGDIYEFLLEAQTLGAQYIVRQSQDRSLGETMYGKKDGTILEKLKQASIVGTHEVIIEGEKVMLSLKAVSVTIAPPKKSQVEQSTRVYSSLKTNIVEAMGTLKNGEQIAWRLITNLTISDLKSVYLVVEYYTKRWHIELFHKCLKTGFSLESSCLEDGHKIEKLIALISIEATEVYGMLYAARLEEAPDPTLFFNSIDLEALHTIMQVKQKPSLKEIVHFIARCGGFYKTKLHPHPGVLTFTRGYKIVMPQIQAVRIVWNR